MLDELGDLDIINMTPYPLRHVYQKDQTSDLSDPQTPTKLSLSSTSSCCLTSQISSVREDNLELRWSLVFPRKSQILCSIVHVDQYGMSSSSRLRVVANNILGN
ncbi:hypothetical protein YC2023_027826 [Brassica napus]